MRIEDFEGCPRYIGRVFTRRHGRALAGLAAGAAGRGRDACDLERRRRDELRHARPRQPAARVRPDDARGGPDRRPPRGARRGAAHARRRPAPARSDRPRHRRRREARRARGGHGRPRHRGRRGRDRRRSSRPRTSSRSRSCARPSGWACAPRRRTAGRRASTRTLAEAGGRLREPADRRARGRRARRLVRRRRRRCPSRRSSAFDPQRTNAVLGLEVADEEQREHPRAACSSPSPTTGTWRVPSWRARDVTREIDLVEEVGRAVLDRIPFTLPLRRHVRGRLTKDQRLRRLVEDVLVGVGFDEAYTWSLAAERSASPSAIRLPDPMTSDQAVLRTTLLPGLVEAVQGAARRGRRADRALRDRPRLPAERRAAARGALARRRASCAAASCRPRAPSRRCTTRCTSLPPFEREAEPGPLFHPGKAARHAGRHRRRAASGPARRLVGRVRARPRDARRRRRPSGSSTRT